jgi:hypothetical protein
MAPVGLEPEIHGLYFEKDRQERISNSIHTLKGTALAKLFEGHIY